jgi:hypothetical protein
VASKRGSALSDRQRRLLVDVAKELDGDRYTHFIVVGGFGGARLQVHGFEPGLPTRALEKWAGKFEEEDFKDLARGGYVRLERKAGYLEGRLTKVGRQAVLSWARTVGEGDTESAVNVTQASNQPATFPEGHRLEDGRFVIKNLLGKGGMAYVYKAVDTRLEDVVALKFPLFTSDEDYLARLRREVQASRRVSHPNVYKVNELHKAVDGTYFLSMELVEGETLKDVLRRSGPLEEQRVAHLVSEIASGLAALHAENTVHRDIKPSNVMVTPPSGARTERVKLIDFGLAKSRDRDVSITAKGTVLGTPAYMSPEQCGATRTDEASEVYSLATLAYELLVGRPPFEGEPAAVVHQHLYEKPRTDQLSPSIRPVLERALAKAPSDRYSSVTDFAEALTGLARGPGPPNRSTRPVPEVSALTVEPQWPGVTLDAPEGRRYFDWGLRMIQAPEAPPVAMTDDEARAVAERFYVRAEAGIKDVSLAYGLDRERLDWVYETDAQRSFKRMLRATFDKQYLYVTPFRGIPRKCVRCGKRYGDAAINCPDCGIPLPINSA